MRNASQPSPLDAAPGAGKRPSAVSQALRAIQREVEGDAHAWALAETGETPDAPGFVMRVANDRHTRRRAYALAQRVYASVGYAEAGEPLALSPFDARPETLTLLAETAGGVDAATISLVFDSPQGLPSDEIFAGDLAAMRGQGRRLVEVTRLAIAPEFAGARLLLIRLFNFIYLHARKVMNSDAFVIEVNPRHVAFYRRLLGFEVMTPQRPCPRVGGAPAVLLHLPLTLPEAAIARHGAAGTASAGRMLYPFFYATAQEPAAVDFLKREHRPMSPLEAASFGLGPDRLNGLLATTTLAQSAE